MSTTIETSRFFSMFNLRVSANKPILGFCDSSYLALFEREPNVVKAKSSSPSSKNSGFFSVSIETKTKLPGGKVMKNAKSKSWKANKISVDTTARTDLFDLICSNSKSPEKCQLYVDRLQLAATNMDSKK